MPVSAEPVVRLPGSSTLQAKGFKRGNLTVLPAAYVGLIYDSNIFGREILVRDDLIAYAAPEIIAVVDSEQHQTLFRLASYIAEYNESKADSFADFGGEFTHNHLIAPLVSLGTQVRAWYAHQSRSVTDDDVPLGAAEPVAYTDIDATMFATVDLQRGQYTIGISYANQDYNDVRLISGSTGDQDFRDSEEFRLKQEYGFVFTRKLEFRTRFEASTENVRGTPGNPDSIDRDATRFHFDAGLNIIPTAKISARLGINYLKEDFHDRR